MREWYKYQLLDVSLKRKSYISIDSSFDEHQKAMGGYQADGAYKSKVGMFNKYLFGYHLNRLEYYDIFIRKSLKKKGHILSVGSGRCANELFLSEDGYKITCSDLEIIDSYKEIKALFPQFDFIAMDILKRPSNKKYDAIMCLSLIYLFDKKDLLRFFKNVSDSLKAGGNLVLDSPGADNFISHLFHEIYLKIETWIRGVVKLILTGRKYKLVIKHHGYRRTDTEVIETARQAGFRLVDQHNYAFLSDFKRSYFFGKLSSIMEKPFIIVGKRMPYVRMFNFQKVG